MTTANKEKEELKPYSWSEVIGNFSRYQIMAFIFLLLCKISTAASLTIIVFGDSLFANTRSAVFVTFLTGVIFLFLCLHQTIMSFKKDMPKMEI